MQTQDLTVKKFKSEEFKLKESKLGEEKFSAPPRTDEPAKFNSKDKKRERLKKKKDSTQATGDHIIEDRKK